MVELDSLLTEFTLDLEKPKWKTNWEMVVVTLFGISGIVMILGSDKVSNDTRFIAGMILIGVWITVWGIRSPMSKADNGERGSTKDQED